VLCFFGSRLGGGDNVVVLTIMVQTTRSVMTSPMGTTVVTVSDWRKAWDM
jgi:hypothetical protein